jgi:heme oxygenase
MSVELVSFDSKILEKKERGSEMDKENVNEEKEGDKFVDCNEFGKTIETENTMINDVEAKDQEIKINDYEAELQRRARVERLQVKLTRLHENTQKEKKYIFQNMTKVNEKIWNIVREGMRRNGFLLDEIDDDEKEDESLPKLFGLRNNIIHSHTLSRKQRYAKFLELLNDFCNRNEFATKKSNKLAPGDRWYTPEEEEEESEGDACDRIFNEQQVAWTWVRSNTSKTNKASKKRNGGLNINKLKNSRTLQHVFNILDRLGVFDGENSELDPNAVSSKERLEELRVKNRIRF